MKTKTTIEANKTVKLDLEIDPEKTGDEPFIEVEFPDIIERPSLADRKQEALKPLYLVRYE